LQKFYEQELATDEERVNHLFTTAAAVGVAVRKRCGARNSKRCPTQALKSDLRRSLSRDEFRALVADPGAMVVCLVDHRLLKPGPLPQHLASSGFIGVLARSRPRRDASVRRSPGHFLLLVEEVSPGMFQVMDPGRGRSAVDH
jgi:hypothetical protein